jgi:hypothetical protein
MEMDIMYGRMAVHTLERSSREEKKEEESGKVAQAQRMCMKGST